MKDNIGTKPDYPDYCKCKEYAKADHRGNQQFFRSPGINRKVGVFRHLSPIVWLSAARAYRIQSTVPHAALLAADLALLCTADTKVDNPGDQAKEPNQQAPHSCIRAAFRLCVVIGRNGKQYLHGYPEQKQNSDAGKHFTGDRFQCKASKSFHASSKEIKNWGHHDAVFSPLY